MCYKVLISAANTAEYWPVLLNLSNCVGVRVSVEHGQGLLILFRVIVIFKVVNSCF
jgi:hypothetical protein